MTFCHEFAQRGVEVIEGHPPPGRNVENLADRTRIVRRCGEQVRLYNVGDVAEVARRFSVAMDHNRRAGQHRGNPARDYRSVGAVRILAGTKNVEVAQAHCFPAVASGKNLCIEFVDVLADRIRRQRVTDRVLDLWQTRMVAVGRTRAGIDKTPDASITCRHEHVEKACGIRSMGRQRVFDRSGYGAQRGLMQYDLHTFAAAATRGQVDDVGFDEGMSAPGLLADRAAHFSKVVAVSGRKVVDTGDTLVEAQQLDEQMRTNEARASRDEPMPRLSAEPTPYRLQVVAARLVSRHQSLHTVMPRARSASASAWHFTSTYRPPLVSLAT